MGVLVKMNISRNCHEVNSQPEYQQTHNTATNKHNIQQELGKSFLLIEFLPEFSVFVIISLIIMINLGVKLSFRSKGNMLSFEFLIVWKVRRRGRRRWRRINIFQPPFPGYLWDIWKILISWRNIRTMSQKRKLKLQVC